MDIFSRRRYKRLLRSRLALLASGFSFYNQELGDCRETATPIYSLIAKPEIKSFAGLKGKVLELSLAVDTISISTRKLLAQNGVAEAAGLQ